MAVYRIIKNVSFSKKRSFCDFCGEILDARTMFPVISFFLSRGKTRCCKKSLPLQYPLVEFTMGVLFIFWYWVNSGNMLEVVQGWIFIIIIAFVFLLDTYKYLVSIPWTWGSVIIVFFFHLFLQESVWIFFLGGLLGGVFYALQYFLSRGSWVGQGDISLGVLFGIMFGLANFLLLLFLSYIIGALVGIVFLLTGKKSMKSQLPMGSFLALGGLITLFFGDRIISYYLSFL